MTKECEAKLLSAIEDSLPLKQAAMLAGVSYDTLNRWRLRGEMENAPAEFRDFCKALERSKAMAMQRLISQVSAAGKRDWRAAAWMLEKRHPDDFGKPQELEPKEHPLSTGQGPEPEVMRRMREQAGVKDILGKFAHLIEKKRLLRENAKIVDEGRT